MTAVGMALRLRLAGPGAVGGAVRVARLAGLVALLWVVTSEHHSDGSPRVPPALLVAAAVAWVGWLICVQLDAAVRPTWLALATLAATGAAVGGLAPVGIAFPAVAVIASATIAGARPTLAVAGLGAVSLTTTVLVAGSPRAIIAEGLLALTAALLGGASRRQFQDRAAQAEQLLAARVRADTAHAHAAALAERNRIGREIHDVLAHSLGALAVQLEAADALLESESNTATARDYVQQARCLAVEGLTEARAAVHALRDRPVMLSEQLVALAATGGAVLSVTGSERRLNPDVEHALYRAAQEALSNVRKHAPGAPVTLHLDYGRTGTVLVVQNGPCPDARAAGPLRQTGGGVGLQGMRERIELLGGEVTAAEQEAGWMVRAVVPG